MKASVLILVAILLTSCIFAQDFAIRQASNIQFERLSIKGQNNQSFIIWEDAADGNTEITVQKVGPSGELLWDNPLSFGEEGISNYALAAERSSDNANLVLYSTGSYPNTTVYLAKFDDNGNNLWTGSPVIVYHGTDPIPSLSMTANATGGAYIVYTSDYSVTNIKGINIDGNGNHLWNPAGQILANFTDEARVVSTHPDNQGGVIVNCYLLDDAWESRTHLVRFSPSGEVVGNNPLVPYNSFSMPLMNTVNTTDGNLLLSSYPYPQSAVLSMQKIDVLGNPIGSTVSYSMQNTDEIKQLVLSPSPNGGVIVAWRYMDEAVLFTRCQSFNSNLQTLWNASGVLINYPSFDLYDLRVVPDQFGGTWLHSMQKIYYVNSEGVSVFGEIGLNYSQDSFNQPLLICNDSQISLFWRQELNRSLSLNRQVFDQNGTPIFPAGGSPIISHLAGFAAYSQTFALDDKYLVLWSDSRIGGKDTKLCHQILSSTGQPLLEENGRELNPESDAGEYSLLAKKLDEDKVAFLYGQGGSIGFNYLQILDSNGNKLIAGNGLQIACPSGSNTKMDCYQGDIYLGWVTETDGYKLRGQKISNLQKQWGEEGAILIEFPSTTYAYITDVCGPYFIFNLEDYNVSMGTSRAVLVEPTGSINPAWGPVGLQMVFPMNSNLQVNVKAALWQNDLITLTRNYHYSNQSLLAQRITPTGQRLWGEAGVQVPFAGNQAETSDLVVDDAISFIHRSSSESQTLCYQRISAEGEVLHTVEDEATLTDDSYFFDHYDLQGFDNGSQIAMYVYYGSEPSYYSYYTDIVAKYISTEGEPSWQTLPICTAPYEQTYVSIDGLGTGALATWTDHRVGNYSEDYAYTSIYARLIASGSTSTEDPILPPQPWAILEQNYPNPFNPSTTIRFSLQEESPVNIGIYNIRGQLVKHLCRNQIFGSGSNELIWNGLDDNNNSVGSGVYYYRLQSGDRVISKRMVLSK